MSVLLASNADRVGPDARKKLAPLIKHYMAEPHPFTACVRDNTQRFGPDRAKRVCAVLKDIGVGNTKWRKGRKRMAASAPARDWAQELYTAAGGDVTGLMEYMLQTKVAIEAAGKFDENLHPRGQAGRFRRTFHLNLASGTKLTVRETGAPDVGGRKEVEIVRGGDKYKAGERYRVDPKKLTEVTAPEQPAGIPRAAPSATRNKPKLVKVPEGDKLRRAGSDSYDIKQAYRLQGPNGEDMGVVRQEKEWEREMSGSIQVGKRHFGTFWYYYPSEAEADKGSRSSLRKQNYTKDKAVSLAAPVEAHVNEQVAAITGQAKATAGSLEFKGKYADVRKKIFIHNFEQGTLRHPPKQPREVPTELWNKFEAAWYQEQEQAHWSIDLGIANIDNPRGGWLPKIALGLPRDPAEYEAQKTGRKPLNAKLNELRGEIYKHLLENNTAYVIADHTGRLKAKPWEIKPNPATSGVMGQSWQKESGASIHLGRYKSKEAAQKALDTLNEAEIKRVGGTSRKVKDMRFKDGKWVDINETPSPQVDKLKTDFAKNQSTDKVKVEVIHLTENRPKPVEVYLVKHPSGNQERDFMVMTSDPKARKMVREVVGKFSGAADTKRAETAKPKSISGLDSYDTGISRLERQISEATKAGRPTTSMKRDLERLRNKRKRYIARQGKTADDISKGKTTKTAGKRQLTDAQKQAKRERARKRREARKGTGLV